MFPNLPEADARFVPSLSLSVEMDDLRLERLLDAALDDTFPASDPISTMRTSG